MADEERNEHEGERPRPRVVDKRVSANPPSSEARPSETPVADPAPQAAPPPRAAEVGAPQPQPASDRPQAAPPKDAVQPPPGEQVWTPEQEAEARRMAEEIAKTPSLEWVANVSVNLINVAATKLNLGDPADASLAIDALAGILDKVGSRLGDVEQPLRQTLAQLQMAFAEQATTPPSTPPG
ncbi:MAG: hypothetical protein ACRDLB_03400 [Actinomycetota bacterium]